MLSIGVSMSLPHYLGMLGLCMRAGKLVSGERASIHAVRTGKAFAVLLDEGAAYNTAKAVNDACTWRSIPLMRVPDEMLGQAIGKPGRMVVAITDHSFAHRILQLAETSNGDSKAFQ